MALDTAPSPVKRAPAADERRRAVRRPHVCEAWVRSPTDVEEDARVEVTALDLSRHGVGFEAHQPLVEGCFYWIEIGFGHQRIAQEIRVRSCVEADGVPGLFRVGAEFC